MPLELVSMKKVAQECRVKKKTLPQRVIEPSCLPGSSLPLYNARVLLVAKRSSWKVSTSTPATPPVAHQRSISHGKARSKTVSQRKYNLTLHSEENETLNRDRSTKVVAQHQKEELFTLLLTSCCSSIKGWGR